MWKKSHCLLLVTMVTWFLVDHGRGQASGDINDCYSQPCIQGTCVDGQNNFTCVCPHLYNGTLCENDLSQYGCLVDPCLNGGTCINETDGSRNYRCDCVNGFVGINCESDVDECESYPCEHGTQCIDKVGNYECNCTGSGFNGTNCDKDINECNDPGVCGTNGQCFNNQGSYTCQCQDGFFGPACQDVDECLSNPCRNNGTCLNEENAFSCTCVLGFTGNRCEVDIDDCSGQTCLGTNSECRDLVNGFECVCKPGFSGTPGSCVDINECSSNPCKNGANCTNLENDFSCQCVAGYTDKSCLTNINECEGNPCQNGATCVDGVNRYSCDCVLGYQGDNCQTNINECDLHGTPCYNGGSCNDLVNGFNCTCAQGFMGDRCTININECESNPCGINSVGCTEGRGTFTCECKPGYTGPTCETNIDECNSSPCRNGGSCTDRVNGYLCNCTADWMGTICNQVYNACSPEFENCKNGASCFSVPPSHEFNCTCLSGFTGNQCETNIDDCRPDSCTLPKVCYDEVNSFSCRCPIGYEGINCTIDIDECQSNPCQHGSTCTEGPPGTYTCNCGSKIAYIPENSSNRTFVTGYEGVNCENDINECDIVPSICLNRGVCQNEDGGFQCLCGRDTDGTYFTGDHCSIRTSYCYIAEEVKNDQPACKYNGTCTGIIGNYTCDCAPGYTGRRCEDEINECESAPCQYNGTCNDEINGYTCDCVPGITGINCEVNIQECDSNPCLYGNCIDGINRYECNCTDTGFKGDNCEINIDDCESNPCIHGSNCTDKIKDYQCSCLPGYEGKNCEIDINECLSNPCQFNSSCHQKSNETLYQIDYPGFENLNFTYEEAAGYLCECVTGSTGVNCEINIDDCLNDSCSYQGNCIDLLADFRCECYPGYEGRFCQIEIDECDRFQPCMHGSTCVDKVADYQCNCAPEFNGKIYAGKNCTFELTACGNNKCEQGICEPYLIDEAQGLQDYRCLCYNGYTGQFCNFSTTISFYSGSYIAAALNASLDTELLFRFRTTLQDAVLLVWLNDQLNGFFVTVELARGHVCMFYGSYSTEQCIPNKLFNTADWHTVFVQVTPTTVQLTVSSSICQTEAECTLSSFITSTSPSHNVTFGSIEGTNIIPDAAYGSQFVGCMRDITVNRERLSVPYQNPLHSYINLVEGCVRELQCFVETCHEKGTCVDLWTNFRCDCYRPYLGTRCTSEHKAATFAYNGSESSATFSFDMALQNELQTAFDLSFFMRSRQPDGLMMYFGSNMDFVSAELELGHITVRISMCNLRQRVTTENGIYSDGEQHLIRLRRNETNFMFYVGDILQYHTPDLSNNCQFSVTSLHLGGKNPFVNNRKRRQALIVTEDTNIGNFDFETDFKGTIQDIQLNGNSLELFPLDDPTLNPLPTYGLNESSGLQEGEVTDPTCDIISPCENNSTCHDVFFNDYRCACLLGYRGKNCSDLDFCVTGECPDGSICQSLLDGFECISNATFNGRDSIATYSHNLQSTDQISVFSFKFRTLSRNGKILEIGTSNRYYRAHLTGSQLMIVYKLDDTGHVTLVADYSISDSRWYTAGIKELDSEIVLTLKDNQNITLVNVSAPRSASGDSLSSILNASSLSVVVGIDEPFNLRRPYYQGCLGEIRIGNILLPFFPDDQFINNTSQERFLLQQSPQSFVHGCIAGDGCMHSQCRSGSQCVDDYYSYTCTCDVGYTGRWCQDRQDFCTQGDECLNEGHCYSGLNRSMCQCLAGYTGDRCQSDVDECGTLGGACRNGGTCQNENGTFTCNCPTDTLGDRCEANITETCDSNPCVHGSCNSINITDSSNNVIESFNCSCNIGYHGYKCDMPIDNCAHLPCKNGANCTSIEGTLDFTCSCPTGYTGSTCDTNIDDCPSEVCQNGGVCVDGFNTSVCNCTPSVYFKGPYCTVDINECEEQQPCENGGLCINLDGRGFTCDCRNTGYNGTYCETDIDECEVQKPCRNGAACTNTIGDYTCNCTDGYEGKDCQTPNCTDIDCTVGTCRIDVITQQWSCDCPQYYEGKYCEIKGLCADEPCNATNTADCTQNSTFSFDCSCLAGWEGDICSEDIDECLTTTCLNSATCQNLPGTFNCVCLDGYTGQLCETDIDDCEVQPCKNGGVCTDLIGGFECNCTGTGYSNETCEVDIDECLDLPCSNGGVCQNTNGNYTCACSNGYQGRNCDVKASPIMEEEQDITWFIVGPAIGVVLILIVIGIVCFVNCVRKKRATRGAYSPSRQEVTGSRVELGNVMKKPPLERLI